MLELSPPSDDSELDESPIEAVLSALLLSVTSGEVDADVGFAVLVLSVADVVSPDVLFPLESDADGPEASLLVVIGSFGE